MSIYCDQSSCMQILVNTYLQSKYLYFPYFKKRVHEVKIKNFNLFYSFLATNAALA